LNNYKLYFTIYVRHKNTYFKLSEAEWLDLGNTLQIGLVLAK